MKFSKTLRWVIGIFLTVYLLIAVGFYFFQDRIIFRAETLSHDYKFIFAQPSEEFFIKTADGESLNALLFPAKQPSKGLIVYFHGNTGNMQRWGQYAIDFTELGYDILMSDYRGYGKSTGTASEDKLYQDAQTIFEWSKSNIPHTRVIFYGRSLGSAVASNLATTNTPDRLILETPFDDLKGTIYAPVRIIFNVVPLRHTFSNSIFLEKVTCKKVIIHGTKDWVVPLSCALRLKPMLKENDRFVIIDGGSHNDLREFGEYHAVLKEALE